MIDTDPYKYGKAICLRSCNYKIKTIEFCTDPQIDNQQVIHDFYKTDIHFDYYDIKFGGHPNVDYFEYVPFVKRYKERPIDKTRMLHFSNDFVGDDLLPVWEEEHFWIIFKELLKVQAPIIVEISNKLRDPIGVCEQYSKLETILRQHDHLINYHFNEDIHYWNKDENAWRSYCDLGRIPEQLIVWDNPDLVSQQ